jgi:hypothetical protein
MKNFTKCLFLAISVFYLASCSKSNDSNSTTNSTNATIDYSGKYQGSTSQKVTAGGISSNQTYDMVIDISKGDNNQEIKILFGVWMTKATLNGTKFTIQETSFNGPIVTTGSGEFVSGNKVTINYTQKMSGIETINYTGTLSKF